MMRNRRSMDMMSEGEGESKVSEEWGRKRKRRAVGKRAERREHARRGK